MSSHVPVPETTEKATVAAGCFWGVEHIYRHHFSEEVVKDEQTGEEKKQTIRKPFINTRVGYIGGDTSDPSYRAVCSGTTGHAEALQIEYDPARVTYRDLIEFFYRIHDPTTLNQQGNDRGTQYRSGIFYHNTEQEKVAREVTQKANEQWWEGKITTEVLPAGEWWDAEDYHQKYLEVNPDGYQCDSHKIRTFADLK